MRRFLYLLLFVLVFWLTYKHLRPVVHAQTTCLSDQTLGWHDCPSTTIYSVCLDSATNVPTPGGCTGGTTIGAGIYAYGGGTFDTTRSRMIIWGGGHNDYGGNDQYGETLAGTPFASNIVVNTAGSGPCTVPEYSFTGGATAASRHTYGQIAYGANIDAMFVFSGGLCQNSSNDMWLYYYSSNAGTQGGAPHWEYLNPMTTCVPTAACTAISWNPNATVASAPTGVNAGAGYDPSGGDFWFNDALGGFWNYHVPTHTMTMVDTYQGGFGTACPPYTNVPQVDTSRHRYWVVHCGLFLYQDISSLAAANQWHQLNPSGAISIMGNPNSGMAYDPVSTHLVLWSGGTNIYDYNPATNTITAITQYTANPPCSGMAESNGYTWGRFAFVPSQQPAEVFTLNNGGTCDQMVFRLSTGTPDTTPPSTPTGLMATAVSQSQINLTWTASTDNVAVSGYNVESCSGGGCSNFALIGSASGLTFQNTGLTASTSYTYRIRAFDGAGNLSGYSSTATATTNAPDVTPPVAPSSLTATATSSSQISLGWTASTDNVAVTGYLIERCSGVSCAGFVQIAAPAGTGVTYVDSGLAGSTSYSYRVRATDAAGNMSSYSNTATDTTQMAPPTTTLVDFLGNTNGFGAAHTDTYGLANWTTTFMDNYTDELTRGGVSGATNFYTNTGTSNFQGVLTATAPRAFVPGEILTAYWYNNGAGSHTFTPKISFTCNTRTFLCDSAHPWFNMTALTLASGATGTTTYTVDGTSTGTYSLVNVAANAGDQQQELILDKIVLASSGSNDVTPPTNPASLTATSISQSQINLSWTASTDAVGVTSYLVERCSGGACGSFVQITTVNGAPPVTTLSDTGLATNTSYSYRVRASDAAANLSGYSNTATATTMTNSDTTPPTTPTALTVQCVSYRQCNLAWTASTDNVGVTGYNIKRCAGVSCVNFAISGTVTGTPPTAAFIEYILATGATYRWEVEATDAAGNVSGVSNIVTATTNNPGPLQVGPDKVYPTLAAAYTAAQQGDTIEIDYNVSGANITQDISKCITIRGVGPPGLQAQFIWDGGTYQSGTGANPLPNDQGIFRVFASCVPPSKVVIDNLKFAGAYGPSRNAAGVRVNPGFNIDFLNDDFENNENGILTANTPTLTDGSPSIITIQNSIFARNGNDQGAHNVYVGTMGHLIFKYNKSVDSHVGHLLKSRAYISEIYSNFFSTKDPAFDGSLEIDLPAGGSNYVIGNVIEQGTNTSNGAILKQGEEPPLKLASTNVWNPTNQLYFEFNTVFNYRGSGTFLDITSTGNDFNNVAPPALTFVSQNSIFANGGTLYPTSAPTLASNNNTVATSADFVSSDTGNYRLVSGASEINAGTNPGSANGFSLTPTTIYLDPAMSDVRPVSAPLDIGAYEFNGAPTPGNAGNFGVTTNIAQSTLTLNWTKGSDAVSPQNTLQYTVYKSTTNNIATVANMLANGTVASGPTTDIATANISFLPCGTTTFFNVLIQNQAGTQAAYNGTSQVTLGCNIHAGRGRLKK